MSLILLKAPRPLDANGLPLEGMNVNTVDVTPGQPPPWIMPHCWKCQLPCERFTIDWVSSPFYLPIQYTCCGRTGGTKVSYTEVMRARHEGGGLLWVNTETKVSKHGRR